MQCPKCKAPVKQDALFCKRCGEKLSRETWQPPWKWSAVFLAAVYAVLAVGYIMIRIFL